MFWDNRLVELLEVEEGMFSVSCRFKNCVNGLMWVFTGMYGCAVGIERISERSLGQ